MPTKRELEDQLRYEIVRNGLTEAILGFNPGLLGIGTPVNQTGTLFKNNRWNLVSNMRQLLSETYVEHGIIQTVVDVPVDDGFRGGIEIVTQQLEPDEITKLIGHMEREDDLGIQAQTAKWNRLFGGAGTLIITDQDPKMPLDIQKIKQGEPVEFRDLDMWELFWSKQNTDDYSEAINQGDYVSTTKYFDYYGQQVHHSRVMLMKGKKAPSFIRPRLRGWGVSVLEVLVNSVNQYLKANNLIFEVLDEFKIDVYKIKNLANTLAQANGTNKVQQRVQLMNMQKNYQNAVTMDSEDDFSAKELSFAGIAETMTGIRMQIASDLRMPLTKVFGISAAGFSSGEDDIENYNAMIESTIRQKVKFDVLKMIEIRCAQLFGHIPDDLQVKFKPLRILSAEQEENVKTQKFSRMLQARQAGEVTSEEFRDAMNKDNLLSIQLDTDDSLLKELESEREAKGNEAAEAPKAPKSTLETPQAKNAMDLPRIATVGIVCGGHILTGQRKDNGLWTFPGGHCDGNESALAGALREAYEECGIALDVKDVSSLPMKTVTSHRVEGKKFEVHPFVANIRHRIQPKTTNDPDDEIVVWRWVPLTKNTHELKPENRHAKEDLILQHLLR